jgi:hypothetical protein
VVAVLLRLIDSTVWPTKRALFLVSVFEQSRSRKDTRMARNAAESATAADAILARIRQLDAQFMAEDKAIQEYYAKKIAWLQESNRSDEEIAAYPPRVKNSPTWEG